MSGPDTPDGRQPASGRPDPAARPGRDRPGRDRPGRRALFSAPLVEGAAPTARAERAEATEPAARGRRALFSGGGAAPPVADRTGGAGPDGRIADGNKPFVVECRTCLARTPMSLVGLGLAVVPSVWLPTRRWPRLMRCPACGRVSWCRVGRPGS